MEPIGTTSVAFSAGRVLFNTFTVEFVSLIVVNGKSDVVGFCACIEVIINPMVKVIVVTAIAIVIVIRFILFMPF
jgi:hypothetical protein